MVAPAQLARVIPKLQRAVNGPLHAVDETPESTAARNFLFEAVTAARAHTTSKGSSAILDADTDTGLQFGGKRVWIECKRITSADKIESNTAKASKQLEEKLTRVVGSGHRGMVAIEVTKLLNKGDKIFVAADDRQLLIAVDGLMDSFIEQYGHVWESVYRRRDRKIIGTMIRFAFMGTSEARNLLVLMSQWAINPRQGANTSDETLLRQLVGALRD